MQPFRENGIFIKNILQSKLTTMKLKFTFLIFLYCFIGNGKAQDTRLKYVGLEAGMNFFASEMSNLEYIRRDIPQYYYDYSASSLTCLSHKSFIGLKYELFSLNDRLSIAGGIRFSQLTSSVGKDGYYRSATQYFYWKLNDDGINTDYLRINEINQTSSYLGIPVEARYFIAKKPHLMRLYAKIGAEVGILLQTKTEVDFYEDAMNKYNEEIESKIDKPKTIITSVYGGFGIEIGGDSRPSLSLEACMPYFNLSSNSTGLVNSFFGGGFQINVKIPLKY
jgi:hypothetical protein